MQNRIQFITAFSLIITLFSLTILPAQDWPQWRGQHRDGKVVGFKAPQQWPAELNLKWTLPLGAGDATPALVSDRLYVFARQESDEVLSCLEAATGKELWRSKYPVRAVEGPPSSHPGPASSPTVANGKVITLGVSAVLSCFDAKTGALLWRNEEYAKAFPECYMSTSPLVCDTLCITHLGGDTTGQVLAYDVDSGKLHWSWNGDGPAFASPMLATMAGTKQVIVQTAKNIIGLDCKNGKLLWEYPTPAERMFFNAATPMIEESSIFVTGQGTGTRAITIFKHGDVFAVKEMWSNDKDGTCFNSLVLKDGLLYGVAGRDERLFCLDSRTGQLAWADLNKMNRFSSILDAGEVLFVQHSKSDLIAVKPDAKKYVELARYKVSEKPVYAHPIIAGNRIYIKDSENLTLWTLE